MRVYFAPTIVISVEIYRPVRAYGVESATEPQNWTVSQYVGQRMRKARWKWTIGMRTDFVPPGTVIT